MLSNSETYHPRLIVSEHFDKIINQIDIATETFIQEVFFKELNDDGDKEEEKVELNKINESREKKIEKLKEIQLRNFTHWSHLDSNDFEAEWSHLINDFSMSYENKMEQIKEKLIITDGILIETISDCKSKATLNASLWIMPFYLNETNAQFVK
jgi:hypothetical protein